MIGPGGKEDRKWPPEGSRVRHWYGGTGTVLKVFGSTARVKWDRGTSGAAFIRDLDPLSQSRRSSNT